MTEMTGLVQRLVDNMNRVIVGKPEIVQYAAATLLAGEHLLLEDVPGVGKTLVGKALAKSIHGDFARLQFTPDLLPSDIIGSSIWDSQNNRFTFSPGSVFAHIVLCDEINRTTPRTQSALLEAMSDRQVSLDGDTHRLPRPFMVVATQNPFEFEGTYPLPESQLDRFLMRISVGYPTREQELEIFGSHQRQEPIDGLEAVLSCDEVIRLQEAVRDVHVDDDVLGFLLEIVHATREREEFHVGVSTRGALSYRRACQSLAFVTGRTFVTPDDVKQLAAPVLAHRVIARGYVQGGQRTAVENIITRIADETPVPR